jgi:hypothetical protein
LQIAQFHRNSVVGLLEICRALRGGRGPVLLGGGGDIGGICKFKEKKYILAISRGIARFPVMWTGGICDGGVVSFRTGGFGLVRFGDTISQGTPAGVVSGFSDMAQKSGWYLNKPEGVGEGKVEGLVVG